MFILLEASQTLYTWEIFPNTLCYSFQDGFSLHYLVCYGKRKEHINREAFPHIFVVKHIWWNQRTRRHFLRWLIWAHPAPRKVVIQVLFEHSQWCVCLPSGGPAASCCPALMVRKLWTLQWSRTVVTSTLNTLCEVTGPIPLWSSFSSPISHTHRF